MAPTFDPEELCRRAEGMRSLARRLVGDAHRAEDVIQEALATSVARPAPAPTSAGAWLRGVVRNLAMRTRRDDARRERRDRSAPPPRSPSDPAEVVARAELHRLVVDAVLALEEPYRSTLLRRFFDGLTAAEIAREQGIPSATVRTRVRRGLALLRERLDAEQGGRRRWTRAFLPLLAGAPAPPTIPPPVPATPLIAGATAMSLKKLAVVVVGLAVLGGVWLALRPPPDEPPAPTSAAVERAEVLAERPEARPESRPAPEGQATVGRRGPGSRVPFRGRVLDAKGRPVGGVRILMRVEGGHETFETNEDGEFDHAARPGRYRIVFDGGEHGALLLFNHLVDGSTESFEFTLEPRVEVDVMFWRGKKAVQGVPVVLVSREYGDPVRVEAESDLGGTARFVDLRPGLYEVSARVLERTRWKCDIEVFHGRGWGFRVLIPEATVLEGIVRAGSEGGEGVAGAVVTLEIRPTRTSGRFETVTESGSDGRYEVTVPRGMAKRITVTADGWALWPGPDRESEAVRSLSGLRGRERVTRDVVLSRGGTLRGVVRTEDGQGVAGVSLCCRRGWIYTGTVVTEAGGAYRIAHLNPGRYALRVETPPWYPVKGQAM
ncbi:MAG: sigma-70 family RNA polymerase sigma factor, partial [Planctomycetota bacterium]